MIALFMALALLAPEAALAAESPEAVDGASASEELVYEAGEAVDCTDEPQEAAEESAPAETEESLPVRETLPAMDGAVSSDLPILYSSDIVQLRLKAMEDKYPEGYPWGDYTYYNSAVFGNQPACVGFANLMSDAAFDDLPVRTLTSFSYDDIHVGDQLWEYDGGYNHMVVVLEKYSDYVLLVEGNYNSSVHWRRKKYRVQSNGYGVEQLYGVLRTRYPVHLAGDVSGDKLIDEWDAAYLLQYLVGDRSGQDTAAADANADTAVDSADAAYILWMDSLKEDGLLLRSGG